MFTKIRYLTSISILRIQAQSTLTICFVSMLKYCICTLKVIIVCGLFSCFGYFVSQIIEDFYRSFTNFKMTSESPQYLDSPTFVLCMEPGKKPSILDKYNVSHEDFIKQFKSPKFNGSVPNIINDVSYVLKRDFDIHFQNAFNSSFANLDIGNNIFKDYDKTFYIEVDYIMNFQHTICYRITPNILMVDNYIPKDESFEIYVLFNPKLSKKDLPEYIDVYITSKINSYGIWQGEWKESDELAFALYLKRNFYQFTITTQKTKLIENDQICTSDFENSYYKCLGTKILEMKQKFSLSCIPLYYSYILKLVSTENFTICEEVNESWEKSSMIFERILMPNGFSKCMPSCIQYGYNGKEMKLPSVNSVSNSIGFKYKFQYLVMGIYQEYLVYDWKGMITSVGGSLGLFLGFSFLDFSFHLINALEKWILLRTKNNFKK